MNRRQFLGVASFASAGALAQCARAAKTTGAQLGLRVAFVGLGGPQPRRHAARQPVYKKTPTSGCLLRGDNGQLYADVWGKGGVIKLRDEPRLHGILTHEATKQIPQSLPRTENHMHEWLQACLGRGRTFSDFEAGGRLTEIVLASALAVRLGHGIAWQGEAMAVAGAPEAAPFIRPNYRTKWLVPDRV